MASNGDSKFLALSTPVGRYDNSINRLTLVAKTVGFAVFASTDYAEFSGLATSVHGEISILLGSQERSDIDYRNLIIDWKMQDIEQKNLSALSGGWARYLSLVLFCEANRDSRWLLFVNGFRYLAPDKILHILHMLQQTGPRMVGIIEPDIDVLTASTEIPVVEVYTTSELAHGLGL